MENNSDKTAFYGKVTANVTHELQNVLAIIKENAGLIEDFMQFQMNPEQLEDFEINLKNILGKIKKQTIRGGNLTTALNGFAHTTDRVEAQIHIYTALEKLLFLTNRLFLLQGIEVNLEKCEKSPSIVIDHVLFQTIILMSIECLMEIPDVKSNIGIRVVNQDGKIRLEICYADSNIDCDDFKQKLSLSAKWTETVNICSDIKLTAEIINQTQSGICIRFN
jgi:C4-dicarboxylate-specific signal transduction histidine kinase